MPTVHELQKEDVIQLAVRCGRVAEDSANYTKAGADEARKLHREWVELAGAFNVSAKEYDASKAKMESLKQRMAEFLAGIL
jgi:hypothetical protein